MTENCGTERITGCQFSLHPMSDQFVEIIIAALEETDTSNVWKETDDVNTSVRGEMVHVFDVVKAIFLHAAKTGEHVAMNGTFTIGCPGDRGQNAPMDGTDTPINEEKTKDIAQTAGCKFALYPLGTEDYMEKIMEQIDLSKHRNVDVNPSHSATRLDGDVHDIFQALHESFDLVQQKVNHGMSTLN